MLLSSFIGGSLFLGILFTGFFINFWAFSAYPVGTLFPYIMAGIYLVFIAVLFISNVIAQFTRNVKSGFNVVPNTSSYLFELNHKINIDDFFHKLPNVMNYNNQYLEFCMEYNNDHIFFKLCNHGYIQINCNKTYEEVLPILKEFIDIVKQYDCIYSEPICILYKQSCTTHLLDLNTKINKIKHVVYPYKRHGVNINNFIRKNNSHYLLKCQHKLTEELIVRVTIDGKIFIRITTKYPHRLHDIVKSTKKFLHCFLSDHHY